MNDYQRIIEAIRCPVCHGAGYLSNAYLKAARTDCGMCGGSGLNPENIQWLVDHRATILIPKSETQPDLIAQATPP